MDSKTENAEGTGAFCSQIRKTAQHNTTQHGNTGCCKL